MDPAVLIKYIVVLAMYADAPPAGAVITEVDGHFFCDRFNELYLIKEGERHYALDYYQQLNPDIDSVVCYNVDADGFLVEPGYL